MKLSPSMVSCVVARRAAELEKASSSREQAVAGLRTIIESTALYIGPDIEVHEFATVSFRVAKKTAPVVELYQRLAGRAMQVASSRARELAESVSSMRSRDALGLLVKAVSLAEAYNVIGEPMSPLQEPPTVIDVFNARLYADQVSEAVDILREAPRVVFFFGSAASLPYDSLLVDMLREVSSAEIVGVIRTERFEDQAALSDAESIGVTNKLDDVISVASDYSVLGGEESGHLIGMLTGDTVAVVKNVLQLLFLAEKQVAATIVAPVTPLCRAYSGSLEGLEAGRPSVLVIRPSD